MTQLPKCVPTLSTFILKYRAINTITFKPLIYKDIEMAFPSFCIYLDFVYHVKAPVC